MLELRNPEDIVLARVRARELARGAGLGLMDQTRFATVVAELGRKVLSHAATGRCELRDLTDTAHVRLQARVLDALPPGVEAGSGLPDARRLVDLFDVRSDAEGNCVTVQIVRRRRS